MTSSATMSDSTQPETITLVSNDKVSIVVERRVAKLCLLLANMFEDLDPSTDEAVPIPEVTGDVLKKVIEWCEHHKDDPLPEVNPDYRRMIADIEYWDQKFLQVDEKMFFDIIMASNYLDIKPLLDVCCKTVANMIQGKSPEEIRRTLNIPDDLPADHLS
ncbi:hypothetical protein V500_00982 [Pseudogymnoascus sp. VKM F-4518 (FW-2643)]|nr:hypothetical protein V500_00982 [Pseudogymnoascus sp. VKM F-4518 (FW-2643)]